MIYQFEKGKTYRGLAPQVVGDELERIRQEAGGQLLTEDVVSQAQATASPLHKVFTWDNEKAAALRRSDEARELIRSVYVRLTADSSPIPAFIHTSVKVINADNAGRVSTQPIYQACQVIVSKLDQYQSALDEASTRLQAAQRTLEVLHALTTNRGHQKRITRARKHIDAAREIVAPVSA